MNAGIAAAMALLVYGCGYLVYSRFLAARIFGLLDGDATPAHRLSDGRDYVPTKKTVLFGHHYASIAGLAPMLGPAVAVIWGWLPAMLWVVLGSLLVGCVHDFGSLVVSVRNDGKSIGMVAQKLMTPRAKTLMHLIIFFLVALGMGIFVYVIAFMLSPAPDPAQTGVHFPQAVIPSFGMMLLAGILGYLTFKKGIPWKILAPIGFGCLILLIFMGMNEGILSSTSLNDPNIAPGIAGWSWILLGYAFLASVLPVWSLLQPRDFINSLLLYAGLAMLFLSLFISQPEFVAPMVNLHPEGAPPLFPFVFIIIACGAASGFHSLVASGTTAKQLDKETDARAIGYGGMIGESLLGLIAIIATTAGVLNPEIWQQKYGSWAAVQGLGPQVGGFVTGCAQFLKVFGISPYVSTSFISVVVVSYALTSLDSATRLLRYNVEEMMGEKSEGVGSLRIWIASFAAVISIGFFAFYEIGGKPAGIALLRLFGTTNQMLAGLALMVITVYLVGKEKPWYYTGIPMVLLLITTLWAMVDNIGKFYGAGEYLLLTIGTILFSMALWLIAEGARVMWRISAGRPVSKSQFQHLNTAGG